MKSISTFIKKIFSTPENQTQNTQPQPAKTVVIDGLNVIYGSPNVQKPSLLNLLGLLIDLNNQKIPYKCFFDANTFFTLMKMGKSEAYAYRRLCHDFPDLFIEVPGHNRADDFLLDYVDKGNATIISNDRYRDFAEKYSWLKSDPYRRASFLVHSGIMQVATLGIRAIIPENLNGSESTIRSQIWVLTGKFVPTILLNQPTKPMSGRINRNYASATA